MATIRWVRYTVPVMVEVDCDNNEITRLVALPEEAREDRDDMGHFLFYDEKFRRQPVDGQIESHALWVANPPNGRLLPGPPQHWPDMGEWEIGFGDQDDDELYEEINPYGYRDE